MSLIEAFAAVGPKKPSLSEVVKHVREEYIGENDPRNKHWLRRKKMEQRIRLYEDDYDEDIDSVINLVFETSQARRQRRKLKSLVKGQNVTGRIVDEYTAVYDKPAKRYMGSDRDQEVFDVLSQRVGLHEANKEAARYTNLCNETLRWFDFSSVDGRPSLRTVTPDAFDIVPDPRDDLKIGAVLLDSATVALDPSMPASAATQYTLWDDVYVVELDGEGYMRKWTKHGMGRIPGYLQHARKPRNVLLDDKRGQDLISAHLCVVLYHVMLIRLSKAQGENQPILSGNLARMVKGQSADGENPIILPPGVIASMLQMKTDPDHFLKAVRHHIAGVAVRYGMSYEQFTFQETADTSSGKAYSVRREKLTEMRDEQLIRADVDEHEIAELMADILRYFKRPSYSVAGMWVDYADPRLPQDAGEELDVLEKGIKLGVDNVIRFTMRKFGYDRKQAQLFVSECVEIRATLAERMATRNTPADPTQVAGEDEPKQLGEGDEQ